MQVRSTQVCEFKFQELISYRSRHVKCDETKPVCNRCTKYPGSSCEYEVRNAEKEPKPSHKLSTTGTRKLAPKQGQEARSLAGTTRSYNFAAKRTQGIPRKMDSFLQFADEQEAIYFRYYCDEVARQIRGTFQTSLWDRHIPQTSETEPAIRDAITAMGAINMSRSLAPRIDDLVHSPTSNFHLQRALKCYGRALNGVRRMMASPDQEPRKVLIACLLFFCLETMQGQTRSATAQASHGANLLHRWRLQYGIPEHDPKLHKQRLNIDEELTSAFGSLDLQALIFLDNRPYQVHRSYEDSLNKSIKLMPDKLLTLRDCQRYWQQIVRRNFHLISAIRQEMGSVVVAGQDPQSLLDEGCADLQPEDYSWCCGGVAPKDIPEKTHKELKRCHDDINRWKEAAKGVLLDCFSYPKDSREHINATIMTIQVATQIINLASTLFPPETAYDELMPEFRTIIELSLSLEGYKRCGKMGCFVQFAIGIIPGLMEVGRRCRDKKLRGQAIDILLARPGYQEGVWAGQHSGVFLDRLRKIEEEGMDENGYIPLSSRISWTGNNVSMENRTTEVNYLQPDEDGGFVIKSITINW